MGVQWHSQQLLQTGILHQQKKESRRLPNQKTLYPQDLFSQGKFKTTV
jgi:hypothetical protein